MPRSWTLHHSPDFSAKLRQKGLPFPVVAKPVRGRGSHGVRLCWSLRDLASHAEVLLRESPSIMVEEYLASEEATVTVMPPSGQRSEYWSLPIVTRFNHRNGIAPYNGMVAVTANSRATTKKEGKDRDYEQIATECERAAEVLGVTAPIRIDVRRFDDSPGSRIALFDVNMKP